MEITTFGTYVVNNYNLMLELWFYNYLLRDLNYVDFNKWLYRLTIFLLSSTKTNFLLRILFNATAASHWIVIDNTI